MAAALAVARFGHYAALSLLFGLAVFPLTMRGISGSPSRARPGLLVACAVVTFFTGVLVLLAMAANMGDGWRSAVDPATVSAAVTDTGFGRIWAGRLILSAAVVALGFVRLPWQGAAMAVASGLLLASIALTGHSAMPGGLAGQAHELADAVHLLAAGWWIGGLAALWLAARDAPDTLAAVLPRFSRIAYGAVALLLLSGLAKSFILVSPVSALVATDYGRLLLLKIGLFGGMGVLALSNRVQLTPAIMRHAPAARVRLLMQVGAELALGLTVLAAVGVLGAMAPPAAQ